MVDISGELLMNCINVDLYVLVYSCPLADVCGSLQCTDTASYRQNYEEHSTTAFRPHPVNGRLNPSTLVLRHGSNNQSINK